jgi:hypothetical protein
MSFSSEVVAAGSTGALALFIGLGAGCADDESRAPVDLCPLSQEAPRVVALEGGSGSHLALFSDGSVRCWGEDGMGVCRGNESGLQVYPREVGPGCLQSIFYQGGAVVGVSARGDVVTWGIVASILTSADAQGFGVVDLQGASLRTAAVPGSFALLDTSDGLIWKGGMVTKVAFPQNEGIYAAELTAVPLQGTVKQLAATDHACALLEDGSLDCWGRNEYGQLGLGLDVTIAEPTLVPAPGPLREVVAGWQHTCVLDDAGNAYCAGANPNGWLVGAGAPEVVGELTAVAGIPPLHSIVSDFQESCGVGAADIWCWGGPKGPTRFEGIADHEILDVSMTDGAGNVSDPSNVCVLLADGTVHCRGFEFGLANCLQPVDGWHQIDFGLESCEGIL